MDRARSRDVVTIFPRQLARRPAAALAVGSIVLYLLVVLAVSPLPAVTGSDRRGDPAVALGPRPGTASPGPTPARGLGQRGRWFTYDGQPTYLVGFDGQAWACHPTFDYTAVLDTFVRYRINKVRIWAYCWWGTPSGYLTPWATTGAGATRRHDLDRWNAAYWRRVRNFVAAARDRRIVVEVTVFSEYPGHTDRWSSPRLRLAWNKDYNVNGAFTGNARGHFYPQFFDLAYAEVSATGRTLRDYQQALVDKIVAELGAFENVYIEVMNEFGHNHLDTDTWHPWQLHWARRVAAATARPVAVHAGGALARWRPHHYRDRPYVGVMNVRFRRGATPQQISDQLQAAQLAGKVLSWNETNTDEDVDLNTRYAWGMFVSGGHAGIYIDDVAPAEWTPYLGRLKALRDIVETVNFWELSPVDASGADYDALIAQGPAGPNRQLIACPGKTYLAYFWGSRSSASVRIALPEGAYDFQWFDVRDGRVLARGTVAGGTVATIPAPPETWDPDAGTALVIRR